MTAGFFCCKFKAVKKLKSLLSIVPVALAKWDDVGGEADNPDPATLSDLIPIIERFLNIFLQLAGLAVFIMIIVGGFQYLTAGGDPKKTQAAGQVITYAVFGLVTVIAAWLIITFIGKFTGVDVTNVPFEEFLKSTP